MSTQYTFTQGRLQQKRSRGKHVVAFLAAPLAVFTVALAVWSQLKQQCAPLVAQECLPMGSVQLGGTDIALLATFLAAGVAAIVEVAAD